jgi:hypothetical protein
MGTCGIKGVHRIHAQIRRRSSEPLFGTDGKQVPTKPLIIGFTVFNDDRVASSKTADACTITNPNQASLLVHLNDR